MDGRKEARRLKKTRCGAGALKGTLESYLNIILRGIFEEGRDLGWGCAFFGPPSTLFLVNKAQGRGQN